jgi:uncharacterized protein (DUF1499 family)
MSILACGGEHPSNLGVSAAGLAPCPSSRNCVSSDASDAAHWIEAFALTAAPNDAWRIIREEVPIRSASRVGYSDLGVDRRRVEQLREALRARRVVQ